MVARLTNDSVPFYRLQRRRDVFANSLPATSEQADNDKRSDSVSLAECVKSFSPILASAKDILRERLAIICEDQWHLDGQPASLKAIIDATNRTVKKMGGRYLSYPGLRGQYNHGLLGMTIRQTDI